MRKTNTITTKKTAYFRGNIEIKYRGTGDLSKSFQKEEAYNLDVYHAYITETQEINPEDYLNLTENLKVLSVKNVLIQRPGQSEKNIVFKEDLDNILLQDIEFSSFKSSGELYGTIHAEVLFFVDYSIHELTLHDPVIRKTVEKEKTKDKTKQAEYLNTRLLFDGLLKIIGFLALIPIIAVLIIFTVKYSKLMLFAAVVSGIGILIFFTNNKFSNAIRFFLKILLAILTFCILAFLLIFFALRTGSTIPSLSSGKIESAIDLKHPGKISKFTKLSWVDYDDNKYTAEFPIDTAYYSGARLNRSNFISDYTSWTDIYKNLIGNDTVLMADIYATYEKLESKHNLDRIEFANAIFTSVQNIPYTWILNSECDKAANSGEISRSGFECLGDIQRYSVQSPYEFISNTKGDCDTKTVFLYCVFKHFGYDAVILLSRKYKHTMIGINIPGRGKFVKFAGKKFYVWETTTKGWQAGQLPPDVGNLRYWHVIM